MTQDGYMTRGRVVPELPELLDRSVRINDG
jgi:hypothetical protein